MSRHRLLMLFSLSAVIAAALIHADGMRDANAQEHVLVDSAHQSYPIGMKQKERLSCGTSPCSVAGGNVTLLNANASRSTAVICNVGASNIFCCLHPTTCSTAAYDVALNAPVSPDVAGSCLIIGGQTGRLWQDGITCAGTAGGAVTVFAY